MKTKHTRDGAFKSTMVNSSESYCESQYIHPVHMTECHHNQGPLHTNDIHECLTLFDWFKHTAQSTCCFALKDAGVLYQKGDTLIGIQGHNPPEYSSLSHARMHCPSETWEVNKEGIILKEINQLILHNPSGGDWIWKVMLITLKGKKNQIFLSHNYH